MSHILIKSIKLQLVLGAHVHNVLHVSKQSFSEVHLLPLLVYLPRTLKINHIFPWKRQIAAGIESMIVTRQILILGSHPQEQRQHGRTMMPLSFPFLIFHLEGKVSQRSRELS
ncbi:hypothetical protein DsansV1_C32g0223201 [Dioscorea sansibarensis]